MTRRRHLHPKGRPDDLGEDIRDGLFNSIMERSAPALLAGDQVAAMIDQYVEQIREAFRDLGVNVPVREEGSAEVLYAILGASSVVVENLSENLNQIPEGASAEDVILHVERCLSVFSVVMARVAGVGIEAGEAGSLDEAERQVLESMRLAQEADKLQEPE